MSDSEMDREFNCPLLKKEIDTGYCYEIGLVVNSFVKPQFLEDDIGDREKAKEICAGCKNNQWK